MLQTYFIELINIYNKLPVNENGRISSIFILIISPGCGEIPSIDDLGKNVSLFVLVLPSNWELFLEFVKIIISERNDAEFNRHVTQ